jgi:purine-binding chemotaxis protein CheW
MDPIRTEHRPAPGEARDRAGAAPRPGTGVTAEDHQVFLTFRLGSQYFALSVEPVREILDEQPVAILPDAPADVVGLIDVRGEGVMVMDVSHRLGVVARTDHGRRIVVVERTGDDGRPVGVLADQVLSVV